MILQAKDLPSDLFPLFDKVVCYKGVDLQVSFAMSSDRNIPYVLFVDGSSPVGVRSMADLIINLRRFSDYTREELDDVWEEIKAQKTWHEEVQQNGS